MQTQTQETMSARHTREPGKFDELLREALAAARRGEKVALAVTSADEARRVIDMPVFQAQLVRFVQLNPCSFAFDTGGTITLTVPGEKVTASHYYDTAPPPESNRRPRARRQR